MINNKTIVNIVRQFNHGWKGYTLEEIKIIIQIKSFEELVNLEKVGLEIEECKTDNNQAEIILHKESYENLLSIGDIKSVINQYKDEIGEKLRKASIEKYNLVFDLYLDHNAYWLGLSEADIQEDDREEGIVEYIETNTKVNLTNAINTTENTLTINGYSLTIPTLNRQMKTEVLGYLGKLPGVEIDIKLLNDSIELNSDFGSKYKNYRKLNDIYEFNQEIESISYLIGLMLEESSLDEYELVFDIA